MLGAELQSRSLPKEENKDLDATEVDNLFSCFENYSCLLLAVSGGSDSMALLALVYSWRERTQKNTCIVVASIDHRLRPESVAECEHVADFCAARNIPHVALTWSSAKPVTGIQEAARQVRYDLLVQAAQTHQCDALVTAHTQDDQAETLLMRLARGSGLAGLQGMVKISAKNGLPLLRPLLDTSRERLRATLRAEGIDWHEDRSNEDARYLRPRLRRLLPQLAAEGLDALRFGLFARKMARANAALDEIAQQIFKNTREGCIERAHYSAAPEEIRLRLLQKMIATIRGDAYPPGDAQLEDLDLKLMSGKEARHTLGGVLFSAGSRYLRFHNENDPRRKG